MRIAQVIGQVTLGRRVGGLRPGRLLVAHVFDAPALARHAAGCERPQRDSASPESLVVFDELGAGAGQVIAVSEGAEACVPFLPDRVPVDAYAAAILDRIDLA